MSRRDEWQFVDEKMIYERMDDYPEWMPTKEFADAFNELRAGAPSEQRTHTTICNWCRKGLVKCRVEMRHTFRGHVFKSYLIHREGLAFTHPRRRQGG